MRTRVSPARHQAPSCSGPLRRSGSSAVKVVARAPLGQVSRRRVGSYRGRNHGGLIARRPLWPSTIVSRTSAAVAPTRAIRPAAPDSIRRRTHSAAARVFPAPRPISKSQVRQSPSGGRWLARARGCFRHSPAGRPHGQPGAYQSHGLASSRRTARCSSSRSMPARSLRQFATAHPLSFQRLEPTGQVLVLRPCATRIASSSTRLACISARAADVRSRSVAFSSAAIWHNTLITCVRFFVGMFHPCRSADKQPRVGTTRLEHARSLSGLHPGRRRPATRKVSSAEAGWWKWLRACGVV